MARYFFHVHDGMDLPDHDGIELADLDAARTMAVQTAADILKSSKHDFWNGTEWKMEVTDETGLTLFVLMFLGTAAPSTAKR